MIKFIHNNKRAIGIVFLIVAVCFMISGVGLDILHDGPSQTRDAAVINGQKLSYADIERQQRRISAHYRNMFGENFEALAQSLNLNIRQQAVDSLINNALLTQEATQLGFTADEEAVKTYIQTELFNSKNIPGGFNPDTFRSILQNMGLTYRQYSEQVKNELASSTLTRVIQDAVVVSTLDAEDRFEKQETKFTVTTAEISAAKLAAEVSAPTDEELQRYYEGNATEFETPASVQYDYIVLDPKDFEKSVQVSPDDIEIFYTENAARFTTPEKAKIRSIKIFYPKESDPAKMAAASEKAKKVREEALQAGVPFEKLVAKYSDDIPSKIAGGDRGWVVKGKGDAAFDSAVFATAVGNISEVVQLEYGFEIVKVEDKQAAGVTPLDQVRDVISAELQAAEAPSYAAAKGYELATAAKQGNTSIKDLAGTQKLTVLSTNGSLTAGVDPEPRTKGLTDKILSLATADRLTPTAIDIDNLTVVVQAREFRDPTTPAFEEVKPRIVTTLKELAQKKLAEQRAKDLLAAAKANPQNFKKEAEARRAKVSGPVQISRAEATTQRDAASLPPAIRSASLRVSAPTVLDATYPSANGYTVAVVTDINKPKSPPSKSDIAKYREQGASEASSASIDAVLDAVKASAELDIDEQLLVAQ